MVEKDQKTPWWKKVPLAVILSVLIQLCIVIGWASRLDERTAFRLDDLDRRLTKSEAVDERLVNLNAEMTSRLARLEENATYSKTMLSDIRELVRDHMKETVRSR